MAPNNFDFLDLPGELRNNIYELLLNPAYLRQDLDDGQHTYNYNLALLHTNKQIYLEARKIFRQQNVFVRVETPWEQAQHHVRVEGNVPIIAQDRLADQIQNIYMRVVIDSPQHGQSVDRHSRRFVLLEQDLAAFTTMWFYSDLSYAGDLNKHLRLALHLQNPISDAEEEEGEERGLTKVLQRKLLEPFGMIKSLLCVSASGPQIDYDGVWKSVKTEMEVPYATPEACLEESSRLKDLGNEVLKKDPAKAIEIYLQAFKALHIICSGRRRSIWGDPWFATQLTSGPFKDHHGQVVRLILRVKLVANVIKAYLDLGEWEEAHFWGMRTILLMREAIREEDEPMDGFPAKDQMGKIFFRTGVAAKMLEDESEARKLLRIAKLYLPHDENVTRMLASVALRLG
ncbi:Tetratricopeptide-like helical [Venturia nashicola]|nr:Tetratricopeptide-like helical [Venturia nashicola]